MKFDDALRAVLRALAAWPLLIVGLIVLGYAAVLAGEDPSDVRALLTGVGAVLTGAGIVLVALNHPRSPPPTPPTERDDDA